MAGMVRITNVVATAHVSCQLNLNQLEKDLSLALYLPERFSGLLVRTLLPSKAHCQMYSNGKITVNGGKSIKESQKLCGIFCQRLRKCGYPQARICSYKVVNLVGSMDLQRTLTLEQLRRLPGAVFEPELFCGLSLRTSTCTAVLFRSGKVNLLGAKDEDELIAGGLEIQYLV